jgi:hypothetical protein
LAAAVPEVQATATGRPVALAMPSAKKPAQRSSSTETASSSGRPASVSTSGASREPGHVTARRMPHRTSSSTNA